MTAVSTTNRDLIERARRATAAEEYDVKTRFSSVIERAEGAWLHDVEGNRILDLTSASGTVILGHRHPVVTEAIVKQIRDNGTGFASTISVPRVQLAERLIERYPCAEKVVFGKSGSEGTTMAIRLARAATGRNLILTSGYHGWHDWQHTSEYFGFVPSTQVACFGYNETALDRMLTEFGDDVAAVIVSPEMLYFDAEFYRRMSANCARRGVLFILDEVYTGFRAGPKGVHGADVPADLVVISKGLANGFCISAVMGRRDVIDSYDAAGLAGTYTREVPPMAAALATLDVIADGSVHEHCDRMGTLLMNGMRDILAAVGIPAFVGGPPMMFDVVLPSESLGWEIYQAAHEHGVYFEDSGTQLVTAAFGQPEIDHALTAFDKAVRQVASSTSFEPGDLTEERKLDFAEEAFGGLLRDDEATTARIDALIEQIAKEKRTATSGG